MFVCVCVCVKEKSKKDKREILCTHTEPLLLTTEMTRSSCMLRALELTAGQKLRVFAHNLVSLPPSLSLKEIFWTAPPVLLLLLIFLMGSLCLPNFPFSLSPIIGYLTEDNDG